jgi:hypothetical protein
MAAPVLADERVAERDELSSTKYANNQPQELPQATTVAKDSVTSKRPPGNVEKKQTTSIVVVKKVVMVHRLIPHCHRSAEPAGRPAQTHHR